MSVDVVRIQELILLARGRNASDLHVGPHEPPAIRVDGGIIRLDAAELGAYAVDTFVGAVLPPTARERLAATGSADVARRDGPGAPYRIHVYRSTGGTRIAIRFLADAIPVLDALGLPPAVATFAARPNGLVLFTGPTGSGKTTALAALVDRINRTAERVIVTVEGRSISKRGSQR